MKRKMTAYFLALVMAVVGLPLGASAADRVPEGSRYRYHVADGWLEVMVIPGTSEYAIVEASKDLSGDFTIPKTLGGKKVSAIWQNSDPSYGETATAFQNCDKLTSLTIPGTIEVVGERFGSFGGYLVTGCTNLKRVVLEEGVRELRRSALSGGYPGGPLESVVLPSTLEHFSPEFTDSPFMTEVDLSPENPNYRKDGDGVIYRRDSGDLMCAIENAGARTEFVVPEGTRVIRAYAFTGCDNLEKLTIPASVTTIREPIFGVGNSSLMIRGYRGSYAEKHAKDWGYGFESILEAPFRDIGAHWARNDIDWAYGEGVVSGESETSFAPESALTRAMFTAMLYRLEGRYSPVEQEAPAFEDVPPDSYFREAVDWASGNGIVKGVSQQRFGVNQLVTREQMATLLYRCYVNKGIVVGEAERLSGFPDGKQVSPFAVKAMNWAVAEGIFSGDSSGKLRPQGRATRGEAAAVLHRYWGLLHGGVRL